MPDRPASHRQLDLLVPAANTLEPNRIPRATRAEVTALLKLLMAEQRSTSPPSRPCRARPPMNKITAEHLARDAYVYVRQSTADQLLNHPESRRRQYALVERARSLGWENVVVIDDDLGRSGGGQSRPGFERLLAAICAGTAGAVLAIEASRLARNGRDWHTLLEFCALVNTLIIDEDGVTDPRLINDRLLLGLKGTFSELELSMFRQRSQEALRLKAAPGELHTTAAVGYRRGADGRLEQDPDRRIYETLSMVFRKFSEIGSVRQLALWLRQEGINLPVALYGPQCQSALNSFQLTASKSFHLVRLFLVVSVAA